MNQPLFDLNLSRVTREHYVTGKAAINFPYPGVSTGGWHVTSYWDRDSGVCKVSLAGIHFPDTTAFFGGAGIVDVTSLLADRGWHSEGRVVWMADHFRAVADMVARWAFSDSLHCNVEIADWFPSIDDRQRFLDLLRSVRPHLLDLGRMEKFVLWLEAQD